MLFCCSLAKRVLGTGAGEGAGQGDGPSSGDIVIAYNARKIVIPVDTKVRKSPIHELGEYPDPTGQTDH